MPVLSAHCLRQSRQPFGSRFPQYTHILQLNNDGYSNYNSLQTAFKFAGARTDLPDK